MHPIHDAVLRFITTGRGEFDQLAQAVFAHQFERIAPYRRYCERHRRSPAAVHTWREIPPIPVLAFKQADLCCELPERVFLTTGTTRGNSQRGRHAVPDLRLYHAAAVGGLQRYLFPDVERMPIVSLIPSAAEARESSLSQMVAWAVETYGTDHCADVATLQGIDYERAIAALRACERSGTPICLMTTTAALLHLLDYCGARQLSFRLPHGARLMDTGGTKGAPRLLSRRGLLQACWTTFAIPGYFCVNEYGMAELSSQFYDNVIATRFSGRFTHRHLVGPPWTRVRVLDPVTLDEIPAGELGLLCLYDLANVGTAFAVLTEDIGRVVEDGFEIRGRTSGAESRGCSLTAAEWGAAEPIDAVGE